MKFTLALAISAPAVAGAVLNVRRVDVDAGANESSCIAHDLNRRVFFQTELAVLGPDCEEMCKKTGSFPKCQCAGFEGMPATDGDTRACITKYCQDPTTPCPTDNFVACVKANTKVSALQWNALLQQFGGLFGHNALGSLLANTTSAGSCQEKDVAQRALLQTALAVVGPDCEAMCKKTGSYPKCQCAGFEGMPASDGDDRACIAKYCQDPTTPCPTDNFVACVKANTKVSALQWEALLQRFGSLVNTYKGMAASTNPTCPQTKMDYSVAADAGGNDIWLDCHYNGQQNECHNIGVGAVKKLKFCGPGELTISRMTCNNHDYKAETIVHKKTEYTTQCEEIDMAPTIAGPVGDAPAYWGSFTLKSC